MRSHKTSPARLIFALHLMEDVYFSKNSMFFRSFELCLAIVSFEMVIQSRKKFYFPVGE